MEKKVPERNVNMSEDDVFYVYEKRINKCVKADCEGTVKYGLILKVDTGHDETINCFECNKCHMKYTPYPNFNRLKQKSLSRIYNVAKVAAWQEHTRKKVEIRESGAAKYGKNKKYEKNIVEPSNNGDQGCCSEEPFSKKPCDKKDNGKAKDAGKRPFKKNRKSYAAKPQTITVRKGNIIITRTVESAQRDETQMKRRLSGPKRNPNT